MLLDKFPVNPDPYSNQLHSTKTSLSKVNTIGFYFYFCVLIPREENLTRPPFNNNRLEIIPKTFYQTVLLDRSVQKSDNLLYFVDIILKRINLIFIELSKLYNHTHIYAYKHEKKKFPKITN